MNEYVDTALALSLLSYFPELSHGSFPDIGAFLDFYFTSDKDNRPETMFSGLCPDEDSGVVAAMKELRRRRFREMRIVCDSSRSRRFNSFCAVDSVTGTAYIVIGGNYRIGFYTSGSGVTSSWCDNFLGAVQTVTVEQKDILTFFDRAVSRLNGQRIIVCGHSKGGSLAQYITLMRGSVGRCYSFDGQGFSDGFIKRHRRLIEKRGGKIQSFTPDRSTVGSLLTPLSTAEKYTVRAMPVRKGLLCCHIPAALLDKDLRLGELVPRPAFITRLIGRVSVQTVRAAQRLPFISAEKGLGHIGKALQYIFKEQPKRGLAELVSPDVFFLLLLLILDIPPAAVCTLLSE
ncbi:MAG: DUF2974 domain-containing protein [Ruminococcus sp.]|nr:DUF2974 domain-containing protein [Ruminococcus sp.]